MLDRAKPGAWSATSYQEYCYACQALTSGCCCLQHAALCRRPTILEGLYNGLGSSAGMAALQLESKIRLLVEAPAAVEDALASLLDHHEATLQVDPSLLLPPSVTLSDLGLRSISAICLPPEWTCNRAASVSDTSLDLERLLPR